MQLKNLLPIALGAASVSAQTLTEALAANNATLSALTGLIAANPALLETLAGLSDITILAPSNDAIGTFLNSTAGEAAASDRALVDAVLQYHVLNGTFPASAFTNMTAFAPTLLTNMSYTNVTGGQRVGASLNGSEVNIFSGLLQSSTVTTADLNFTGGVIHVIDEVLTLPASISSTALAAGLIALVGALNATDLISTVDELEDVTVFAPSNAAFAAIGSAAANLTTEQATDILTYHVVQGTVGYSTLLSNTTLTTVNGAELTVSIIDGSVFINSAKVMIADVLVANGVVHVIDNVLNPGNPTAMPNPSTTEVAFPGASTATDGSTPFTSGVSAPTTVTNAPTDTGVPGGAASTSLSTGGAPAPTALGMIGAGALLGGGLLFAL